MPKAQDTFRISAALKTIIGRELITNDFVAVFELVKNAFDAHARNAEIRFEGLHGESPWLLIKDDGKGMTADDIDDKWLFVAYSAKREGTEDNVTDKPKDYREKIAVQRTYAGAKGIGRFSCDRLGRYLDLYTRVSADGPFEHLRVDWQDFELDSTNEFADIKVVRATTKEAPVEMGSGTALVITGLRESWDRNKLKSLRNSLRKLINPNQENDSGRFSIELAAPDETDADRKEADKRDRVNGKVKNFLFEELGLKTTEIHCEVNNTGVEISTSLTDRGTSIYRLREKCPYGKLANVKIHLFALNRSAKIHFHRVMGVHNVAYGSVFLYKNGFRVHGIGDEGDDGLGIDRRKQQGTARYLGTRDLSGRIEIMGDNKTFKEVSSRDAGIIQSEEWEELIEFFYDYALKRLERYAVDVIKWGNPPPGTEEELRPSDVKAEILNVINRLTGAEGVLGIDYDRNLLEIMAERQSKSVTTALTNFKRIAEENNNPGLKREVVRAERRLKQLATAKDEAETEARTKQRALALSRRQLAVERQKNRFLMATAVDPERQRLNMQHWIGIAAQEMTARISSMIHGLKKGTLDREKTLEGLGQLQLWTEKVQNASRVATRADFSMQYPSRRMDLARFVFEYLNSDIVPKTQGIELEIANDATPFTVMMRPVDITIVLDNLISNAIKAHARHMRFQLSSTGKTLRVAAINDGEAVPKAMAQTMFDLGISGRGGSGIGLYTCREIMKEAGGKIEFLGNDPELGGAAFELTFYS